MRTRVFDIPTRLLHAALIAGCAAAMLTSSSARSGDIHAAAGTLAFAAVLLRIVWGFVGERWSRLRALGQAPGHSVGASISALFALGVVLMLGITGLVVLGGEELRGPLAKIVSPRDAVSVHTIHSALAWGGLAWLGIHLLGALRESLLHRENLFLGMIDGHKRWDGPPVRRRAVEAALMALVAAGAVLTVWGSASRELPALAQSPVWEEACGECHLAFHPSLLPGASWSRMLSEDEHFGESLGLTPDQKALLAGFALSNAAEQQQSEHAARASAERPDLLRITESSWWREAHEGLPAEIFEREDIGSELRCSACHRDSEQGTFDGRAAEIPAEEPARRFTWRSP